MKAIFKTLGHPFLRRLALVTAAALALVSMTGCYTTYDAYGRPVQSVDPALAIAGIAAAGLIGYAIADDDDDHHYHGGGHHGYASHGYSRGYGGGYNNYRGGGYCRY